MDTLDREYKSSSMDRDNTQNKTTYGEGRQTHDLVPIALDS